MIALVFLKFCAKCLHKGNLTDRGEGFVHDLTSLARDVATGVLARSMDLDIYNLHPAHAKRIEEIIAENKPPFSVFRQSGSQLAHWQQAQQQLALLRH